MKTTSLAPLGDADVSVGGKLVATIWNNDPTRPTALFMDTGAVSEQKSRGVMESLQPEYGGKLRWVASPAKW